VGRETVALLPPSLAGKTGYLDTLQPAVRSEGCKECRCSTRRKEEGPLGITRLGSEVTGGRIMRESVGVPYL